MTQMISRIRYEPVDDGHGGRGEHDDDEKILRDGVERAQRAVAEYPQAEALVVPSPPEDDRSKQQDEEAPEDEHVRDAGREVSRHSRLTEGEDDGSLGPFIETVEPGLGLNLQQNPELEPCGPEKGQPSDDQDERHRERIHFTVPPCALGQKTMIPKLRYLCQKPGLFTRHFKLNTIG
jgi:hypothetical protein